MTSLFFRGGGRSAGGGQSGVPLFVSVGFVPPEDIPSVSRRRSVLRLAEPPRKGLFQCVTEKEADGADFFDCFFL